MRRVRQLSPCSLVEKLCTLPRHTEWQLMRRVCQLGPCSLVEKLCTIPRHIWGAQIGAYLEVQALNELGRAQRLRQVVLVAQHQ